MNELNGKGVMSLVVTVAIAAFVVGSVTEMMISPTRAPQPPAHVYLSIGYNPYTGLDEYFPANFSVPLKVRVVFTITNYDNGTNPIADSLAQLTGVQAYAVNGQPIGTVSGQDVAHTFMIGQLGIAVPIPPAQDTTPTVVTFTVTFTQAGTFEWHCMAPCDGAAMSTPGFMTGSLTVVGS